MGNKIEILAGVCLLFQVLVYSCNDSNIEPSRISTVTSNNGNTINLDGQWDTGCVTDNGTHLSETFAFDGNGLVIEINIFQENGCAKIVGTEKVKIDFHVVGTIEALLNGNTVIANKITGTQTMMSSGASKAFKQIFYVNDDGDDLILHHARFQDDGGVQSSDGFPIELIPIDIVKE